MKMLRPHKLIGMAAALGAITIATAGCSGSDMPATTATSTPTPTATAAPTPTPTAVAQNLGCQTLSANYPWGKADLTTWTPVNTVPASTLAGVARGAAFQARLIQAYGTDSAFSARTALFEMADGCRRQFAVASFTAADIAKIDAAIAPHPFDPDTNQYAVDLTTDNQVTQAQIDSGAVKQYSTQHFNLLYGVQTGNFSYLDVKAQGIAGDTFVKNGADTLERAWLLDRDLLNAPMPYANATDRKKVNVYICGTGLPFIANGDNADCGASAAAAVYVSSVYLKNGSTTMVHEFTHAIQFYSGGLRGTSVTDPGPIWETGADWASFTQSPTIENGAVYYFDNLENGPLWSNSRYGAFPFMSFLYEQDRTRPFVWSPWTGNLRASNGDTKEDFVQALVRQAQASGVYPAGYQSFADDMGWYGARLVAMDFFNQRTLLDVQNTVYFSTFYTPLVAGSTTGSFSSPAERPLLQWGSHIVPLTGANGTVSVSLTGRTAANSAAWRFTIVSVATDGTPRYAPMAAVVGTGSGATSLPVVAGEKVYLVVTATPYAYQALGWQPDSQPVKGNTFPYDVTITGATPQTGNVTSCNSVPAGLVGQNLNYNINGNTAAPIACR